MNKLTLPVMFCVRDQSIPARLSLADREVFAHGAGMPRPAAAVLAMQDRAASLAVVLGSLVERSGRPDLLASANQAIQQWNAECEQFFASAKIR